MTDAQLFSIHSMRTFVQREIEPFARAMRCGSVPRDQLLDLTQAVSEFGLPGMSVPKVLGGHGVDWVTQGRLFEELVMGSVELAIQVLLNTLTTTVVLQNPMMRERHLPDLIAGRTLAGITLNGPASVLHGRRTGDSWIIDGRCDYVAANLNADVLICAVRESSHCSSWLLLDRTEVRYEVRPYQDIEGKKHRCLQVTQARACAEREMGEASPSSPMTRHLFDVFKLHEAVIQLARGQALLDASIARAKLNTQFGRPIAAQHWVATQFAELATQLEAARMMCGHGFQLLDAGHLDGQTASRARLLTTETAQRVERRVRRIDTSNARQETGTDWPYTCPPLPMLSEDIAEDAQRIADELIGNMTDRCDSP